MSYPMTVCTLRVFVAGWQIEANIERQENGITMAIITSAALSEVAPFNNVWSHGFVLLPSRSWDTSTGNPELPLNAVRSKERLVPHCCVAVVLHLNYISLQAM